MVKAFGKIEQKFTRTQCEYRPKHIDGIIKYSEIQIKGDLNDKEILELQLPFYLLDALAYSRQFTVLDLVKVTGIENSGIGSKLLQSFLARHKYELILLNAGATDEETYNNHLDEHLEKLTHFYEKNGFKNINDKIGFYEDTIVFGYNNKILRDTFFLQNI